MVGFGATDTGKARVENQDDFYLQCNDDQTALGVVCDGIGGARAGKTASKMACEIFVDELKRRSHGDLKQAVPRKDITESIEIANRVVFQMSMGNPDYRGMGTTMVGALVNGAAATIFNIGDSRAYLLHGNALSRITRDHSVVEDLIYTGGLTAEEARSYPGKNLITRALGTDMNVECDFFPVTLTAGDRLLLCSDGLNNMLEDHEIETIITQEADLKACCSRLIDAANERGGLDNITVALLAF